MSALIFSVWPEAGPVGRAPFQAWGIRPRRGAVIKYNLRYLLAQLTYSRAVSGPVGEPPCLDALPGRDVFANDIAGLDSRRMIPAGRANGREVPPKAVPMPDAYPVA